MTKPDYAEFDMVLKHQICKGVNTLSRLDTGQSCLRDLAKPFCVAPSKNYGHGHGEAHPTWRIIDRRLQALRKKGVIRFDGKVWLLVE